MKKYIFFSIIALAAIFINFSCKKSMESDDSGNSISYTKSDAEAKVLSFLSLSENPLKDEKLYSTDSAIWYSEAALNFTYSIYDSSYVYLLSDTNEFSFDLDQNNNVTQAELEQVFSDMEDALDEFHDGIQENIKHVLLCDVEEVDISGGKLNVIMRARIACGYSGYEWSYFDATDYWYAIWEYGKCNGYTGEGDAAIRITESFMTVQVAIDPDRRIWFTDQVAVDEVNPLDYPYTPAPYGYRSHYNSGYDPYVPTCLSPSDLVFYRGTNGIQYIIIDQNPNPQGGFEMVNIEVIGDGITAIGIWDEIHFMYFTYGIKHETTVPASGL